MSVKRERERVPPACSGLSDRVSRAPASSSARKNAENTEEYPDDPKPAEGGDVQMEYSDYFFCQSIGAVTKNCQ
jgi:hypothetical protein